MVLHGDAGHHSSPCQSSVLLPEEAVVLSPFLRAESREVPDPLGWVSKGTEKLPGARKHCLHQPAFVFIFLELCPFNVKATSHPPQGYLETCAQSPGGRALMGQFWALGPERQRFQQSHNGVRELCLVSCPSSGLCHRVCAEDLVCAEGEGVA